MATELSPVVSELWDLIGRNQVRALDGGSVPNLATELTHSYHRSWDDSPHDDGYSVHYWGDKHRLNGISQYACALDVTFRDPELMKKYTARLRYYADHRSYHMLWGLREFAGTLDGKTVYAMDLTSGKRTYGWDTSHLWHIHLSFNRRVIMNRKILRIANVFEP